MKNLIVGLLVATTLLACKKEVEITNTENSSTDEVTIIADSANSGIIASAFTKLEFSPDQTTEFLQQKNDTLYVTNFFATWCGPCVKEIPHFKAKMEELKSQPVKFTFISLDQRSDWDEVVPKFVEEQGLTNVVLLDGSQITPDFFAKNFTQWDGGAIPFTFMRKGEKTNETVGMMSEQDLNQKLASFK